MATVKALGDAAALGQVVFFRSAVAMVPLVIFLWLRNEFPVGLATRRPLAHLKRCVLGGAAMFTSFAALAYLPIAEATMLAYLSPVIVVALAATLLADHAIVKPFRLPLDQHIADVENHCAHICHTATFTRTIGWWNRHMHQVDDKILGPLLGHDPLIKDEINNHIFGVSNKAGGKHILNGERGPYEERYDRSREPPP